MGVSFSVSNTSHLMSSAPRGALDSSSADGATTWLPDGDHVVSSESSNGASDYQVHVQLYSPHGAPIGPAFVETAPPVSLFTDPVVAAMPDGSYEAGWVQQGNYSSQLLVEHFNAQGEALGQATLASYGGFSVIGHPGYALAGLPDGELVGAWTVADTLGGGGPTQVYAEEFTAAGTPVGGATLLGAAASADQAPLIRTEADNHYVVSWNSPTGPESQAFADPPGTPPQELGAAHGWQGALASIAHAGGAAASSPAPELHPFVASAVAFTELGHAVASLHAAHMPSFSFV